MTDDRDMTNDREMTNSNSFPPPMAAGAPGPTGPPPPQHRATPPNLAGQPSPTSHSAGVAATAVDYSRLMDQGRPSEPTPTTGISRSVETPGAFLALYRLVLRHQVTRGRLVLFAVIGAISVALGWVIGRSNEELIKASTDFVSLFGLGLVVPVIALVLGSAALGNWVEDETLVYVWLRPVKRWTVAAAATLAAATVAVPVTVVSMVTMAALGSRGDSGVIIGAALGSALGSLAYVSLFVLAGLVIRRALLWGLVYVFIWEFFVARAGAGAARLSINSYAASILADWSGIEIRLADRGLTVSYAVLIAAAAVAGLLTTWRLSKANVA